MFYAHFVLSKKGPLARIWLAAHWDKKLTKAHVFETNIEGSVEAIIQPKMKLALRTSGHLLLGVVRIYSRKAKYLLADCNEAFVKIKMAFRPGAVDLPEENREAAMAAITLPEDFHEFDTTMADLSDIDVHAQFAVNQSRPEEITMREELGNIPLVGDDGFGDMGFDGSAGVIQDANLDDSLYKHADAAFLLGDDGVTTNNQHSMGFDDGHGGHEDGFASGSDNYEGPGDDDDDNESVGGNFSGDMNTELFGENFTGETGGLFEEPPSLAQSAVDSVACMPLEPRLPAEEEDSIMMSPSRQSRFALNDITLQQNVAAPLLTNSFDQTAFFNDEAEAFALEPIDINTVGTERKVRKKRKLVIDEQKAISSETMKIQLSDTSEIVTTLDLAPPTKKLMHWKETGGVEKLFAFSGRPMVSKRLAKLFTNNLITRSATAENGDTTMDSVSHNVEQGRFRNDSAEHTDLLGMPQLAPALQDAYCMPASVAPCIVDDADGTAELDSTLRLSSFAPSDVGFMSPAIPSHHRHSPTRRTPGRTQLMSPPRAPLPDVGSPAPIPTPSMNTTSSDDFNPMQSYGGGDSDDDNYGGFEPNDDDDDDDVPSDPEQEDVTTLDPVDDTEPVEEGKEAEAEERRWNKRSQQMLVALNKSLQRHDSVSFRQMAPPSAAHSRKQAAAKFYTFLVLKKMEAIHVSQDVPYGDILISRGPKFELLG